MSISCTNFGIIDNVSIFRMQFSLGHLRTINHIENPYGVFFFAGEMECIQSSNPSNVGIKMHDGKDWSPTLFDPCVMVIATWKCTEDADYMCFCNSIAPELGILTPPPRDQNLAYQNYNEDVTIPAGTGFFLLDGVATFNGAIIPQFGYFTKKDSENTVSFANAKLVTFTTMAV
jgi:hypothetical protein